MSTEVASALMFQNFEKYVNKSSIFNKVAAIGLQLCYKWIPVSDHSTESEAYSKPCQISKMECFARIFIGF